MTWKSLRFPLLASCFAGAAFSQSAEFAVTGGISRLNNTSLGAFASSGSNARYSLGDGFRIGFRTTLNTWRYFGQEFGYGYNRSELREEVAGTKAGMAIHQGFYNLLAYGQRDGGSIRPFVAGGVHFNNYTPPGTSVTSGGGSTKIGFNYGGGIKIRVSQIFAIRFDARYYMNAKPFGFLQDRKGLLGQLEISAGFGLVI